jgi:P-loop Nucleotide Kinase3
VPAIKAVILGEHRPPFSGTDTLSMGVARVVEKWIEEKEHNLILGEGDRLCYERFFRVAEHSGYKVMLYYIDVSAELAEKRRLIRSEINKTKIQSKSWCEGRATKAFNIFNKIGGTVISGNISQELIEKIKMEVFYD